MLKQCKDHLESVDESYFVHMGRAFGFGGRMIGGGIACILHALIPGLFTKTGSRAINRLYDRMVINRTDPAR